MVKKRLTRPDRSNLMVQNSRKFYFLPKDEFTFKICKFKILMRRKKFWLAPKKWFCVFIPLLTPRKGYFAVKVIFGYFFIVSIYVLTIFLATLNLDEILNKFDGNFDNTDQFLRINEKFFNIFTIFNP